MIFDFISKRKWKKLLKEEEIEEDEGKSKQSIFELMDEIGIDYKEYFRKQQEEIDRLDKQYDFPILRSQAIRIANQDENLKTDYCRHTDRKGIITYLSFSKTEVDVIELNNKKYFQIQVTKGDISGADGNTMWDGYLVDDDFKLLRCLIDVETGEYKYYPEK